MRTEPAAQRVPGTPAGCEEDAHAVGEERTTALELATPSLGGAGVPARPSGVSRQCSRGAAMPRSAAAGGGAPALAWE